MPSARKCIIPGCHNLQSSSASLFKFPKNDEMKKRWIDFVKSHIDGELRITTNTRLCSDHFTPDSFINFHRRQLGFTDNPLLLVNGAEPTISLPGLHPPPVPPTPGAIVCSMCSLMSVNTPSTALEASTSVVSGSSVDTVSKRASVLTSSQRRSTSSQASSLNVQHTGVDTASPLPSVPVLIASGALSTSSQSPPPAELRESLSSMAVSMDGLNESSHQETELSSTTAFKSDVNAEKDLNRSKTIVNDSCLMELFKKCQTCGKPITKRKVSHCGAQKKVSWSCLGGHSGIWMSSPLLWDAFPEIHLLTALSILFSGGSFTKSKKWAKHLHLNFMGRKAFYEIQKSYLNPETNRTDLDKILKASQQLEGTLLHQISDPLKKSNATLRTGALSSLSSYGRYKKLVSSSVKTGGNPHTPPPPSLSSWGTESQSDKLCQQDDDEHQCDSTHMASDVDWLQDRSDSDSDVDNVAGTAELSAPGADDSCDEEVYVPIIPQRSKMSQLLLECEEEELEPWQKQTSQVHLKDEDDVGELSIDQTDCKPDPASLQTDAPPPKLKEETLQPVVFNNQGFIVASRQLTSNTEFITSAGNSLPIVKEITDDDLRELRGLAPNAAVLTSMDLSDTDSASESDTETNLPEPLTSVYDKQLRGLPPLALKEKSLEMFQRLRKKLTSDQCETLELATREQPKCRAWHTHREGRITSSNFHHLCTAGEPTDNDIKNIMHYKKTDDLQVPAVLWAREMEDTARKCYIEEMSKGHTNFFARLSGLVIHPDHLHLGASPDGIVSCLCCGRGTLEIKCPYKYREGLTRCNEDPQFCLDTTWQLKRNHPYYYQVQLQIFVCDVSYSDFVIWTKQVMVISRIVRDEDFLLRAVPKAEQLFLDHLLPELLTRSLDASLLDEHTLYCSHCNRPDYDRMVHCAKCKSSFHYKCVQVKGRPSKWLCKPCIT